MSRTILNLLGTAALGLALLAPSANATLSITAAGATLGFSVDSVVSGFPFNGLGPIGITVLPNGNILANSVADSTNYVFADTNNQTFAQHIGPGVGGNSCCAAYATSNGWAWGGQGGHLVRFNNDGSIAQSYNAIPVSNGVWTNPVNGHLLIASGSIFDVDVSNIAAPSSRLIPGTQQADGLTVSPDGKIVYTSAITGYNIDTGSVTFTHAVSGGDGMGIITSSNSLNGDLVANTNGGQVILIDPTGVNPDVIIADGGDRGDYTTNDPNGSLLLTQGANIVRLSCGAGCGIGSAPPPTSAPEPASIAMLAAGLVGLRAARRRQAV
jgi:hypothetical protein